MTGSSISEHFPSNEEWVSELDTEGDPRYYLNFQKSFEWRKKEKKSKE
jgi:hypothetical protein